MARRVRQQQEARERVDPSDIRPTAELRSFGRTRGRKLSPRQERLIAELLPKVAVDLGREPAGQGLCQGQATWLEIGFGGGEHLLWQARHNPDVLLIGCEPFVEGVVKALHGIETGPIDNVRLHDDDARPLLKWLPVGSIARCFVLFPDPWPKKRHVKRRLVSASTLRLIARALKPGGQLRIATDIGDYARTILIAAAEVPELAWTAQSAADWRTPPADWPGTRYEAKAIREGRRRYFLDFVRTPTPSDPRRVGDAA